MYEAGLHVELIQISIDLCDAQVIQGFRDLLCYDVSSSGTPLPQEKMIAKMFLLNILSELDQTMDLSRLFLLFSSRPLI